MHATTQAAMERLTIGIRGMSCGGCVNNVRRALGQLSGVVVETVTVGSATLSYDPAVSSRDTIASAITRAGYAPQPA
jgi:copper chaperone CopZ